MLPREVSTAEYQANLAICIDPQWQHLCRPELLPDNTRVTAYAPRRQEDAGGHSHVVEDAEAGAEPGDGMVAAAGSVAGDPMIPRQARV